MIGHCVDLFLGDTVLRWLYQPLLARFALIHQNWKQWRWHRPRWLKEHIEQRYAENQKTPKELERCMKQMSYMLLSEITCMDGYCSSRYGDAYVMKIPYDAITIDAFLYWMTVSHYLYLMKRRTMKFGCHKLLTEPHGLSNHLAVRFLDGFLNT